MADSGNHIVGGRESEQARMILRQVQSLPPLAPVASRLLALQDSAKVDLAEIASLVETDPVLSGRILGLCRKADRGVAEKITSVRRAVVLVGIGAVRGAVLGASAFGAFGVDGDKAEGAFDRAGFWKYCVCVACTAEMLASSNRAALRIAPEEAFVAGLLHAIGKLVLDHALPKAYGKVIELARHECEPSATIERRVLGVDYHRAGKELADFWNLPAALAEVMLLHATPFEELPESENKAMVGLISGSAAFVQTLGLGWSGDFALPPKIPILLPAANIRPPEMAEFGDRLLRAVSDRLSALGLSSVGPAGLAIESIMEATRENRTLLRTVRDLSFAIRGQLAPDQAPVSPEARMLAEAGKRAKQNLSIVTSKTQLLAMRLHDARDRAAAAAIVEASRELESILESAVRGTGGSFHETAINSVAPHQ
ncbi:MAG: HDOD domain-containing protein [Phycisphaeraceae bacterium]|nr:HDOD domain-containing protein [Phycisphaeraceae bacterium]